MDMDKHEKITIIHTELSEEQDLLLPFAVEEALCRQVGEDRNPVVHLWTHSKGLVLGLRDRKLPHALKAMELLEEDGRKVVVRHSGGAAVPLDSDVLNVSLIFPKPTGAIDFHDDFHMMVQFIKNVCNPFQITFEAGEIQGSYCPGEYDLSIHGRKFCGIAQRRQAKAFLVHAFIVIEGKGEEKAKVAERFYQLASGGDHTLPFPNVVPQVMGSLQQLTQGSAVTVSRFKEQVLNEAFKLGARRLIYSDYAELGNEFLKHVYLISDQLRSRYEKR